MSGAFETMDLQSQGGQELEGSFKCIQKKDYGLYLGGQSNNEMGLRQSYVGKLWTQPTQWIMWIWVGRMYEGDSYNKEIHKQVEFKGLID